jgi:putative proteasome-type protease
MTTLRKVVAYSPPGGTMFVMTSGLRSLRDKTLTYFENALVEREAPFDRLFEAVNLLATQVRQVAAEDKAAIVEGGLSFNIHALVGGQMAKDGGTKLYLLYPEGNWVDTGRLTPYHIIGSTGYGKPVVDRALKFEDSMRHAFKVGCLSFDSTRISAADVGFPMDAVLCRNDSFEIVERRFHKEDLEPLSNWWQERMRRAINEIPTKLIDQSFDDLKSGYVVQPSDHLGQT